MFIQNFKIKKSQEFPLELLTEIIEGREILKQKTTCFRDSAYRSVFLWKNCIVKHYKNTSVWDGLSNLFFSSKAEREWRMLNKLFACGINVPKPFAFAKRKVNGLVKESILIIEAVDAPDLFSFKDEILKKNIYYKFDFAKKLASFVKDIHDKCFFHKDLHGSNILFSEKDDKFYLIDLHRGNFFQSVSLRKRIKDLAYMQGSLGSYFSNAVKYAFFKKYAEEYNKKTIRHAIHKINFWCAKYCELPYKNFVKKQEIFKFKKEEFTFWFFKKARMNNLKFSWNFEDKSEVIKATKKQKVLRVPQGVMFKMPILFKKIEWFSVNKKLRFIKEIHNALRLKDRDILTPEPIFLREEKFGKSIAVAFRFIDGAQSADAFFYSQNMGVIERRIFIKQLGAFVGKIHKKKIFHKDLKCANILVRKINHDFFQFFLVDNDRILFKKNLKPYDIIFNLAQINASFFRDITEKDRVTFLRAYASLDKTLKAFVVKNVAVIDKISRERRDRQGENENRKSRVEKLRG